MSAIYEAMRPYQRHGAKWLRTAGNALLADQPGVGKTIQTLGTIIAKSALVEGYSQEWHLVFCPSVAVENVWVPEVHRWLGDHPYEVLALSGSLANRTRQLREFHPHTRTRHVFVVTNLEAARIKPLVNKKTGKRDVFLVANAVLPALFDRVWDTIVIDESHRVLVRTSGTPSQARGGLKHLRSHRRLALSGTPMRGKPEQLWGTLNWLYPDVYTSYWKWVENYYRLSSNGYSNYVLDGFQVGGKKRLARDLRYVMLRRTKEEVMPELPPKTYAGSYLIPDDPKSPAGIWLQPLPAQRKQLALLESDGVVITEGAELMAQGTLAVDTRRKQLAHGVHEIVGGRLVPTAESPKLEWLLEWLDNADGEQIVVASQFTSILNMFARELRAKGYSVGLLTGETSNNARNSAISGFQNGNLQVFLLNTAAGGVAVTLDAADYLVLLDETFVPDDQEQVEDRVHRASRIHNVTIWYLRTLGTIEEEVAYVTAARYSVMKYLLDEARGVENARRLYLESRAKAV